MTNSYPLAGRAGLAPSVRMLLIAAAACLLQAPASRADQVVWPNAQATLAGNAETCIPLTGCDGVARYQQVFDSTQFSGIGVVNITGMRLRPDEGKWPFEFHQITNAQISLGTTLNGPRGLVNSFAANFNGSGPVTVFSASLSGPLTLSSSNTGPAGGPKAFDIEVAFDTPFSFDPRTGDLVVEFKNISGDVGQGRKQLLDAQTSAGDASCRVRVWNQPSKGKKTDPNAPLATNGDCTGLVVQFIYQRPDPTAALNLLAAVGTNVTVAKLENLFEKIAAGVDVRGFTDINICIVKDSREVYSSTGVFQKYFQQHLPLRDAPAMAGSCDFLATSDLRLDSYLRGFPSVFRRADGSVDYGVFMILVHSESDSNLVFTGPQLVNAFHEFFADNMDLLGYTLTYAVPPVCNTTLPFRWIMAGGSPTGPNTNMRSVTARCNRLAGIVSKTDLAIPMRQDATMFDEGSAIQGQINLINGSLQAAAQCVDAAAANGIALMQGQLSAAHNGFAQSRYTDARLAAEQLARYAQYSTNNFSGCPPVANYKGEITALAVTLAFMLWDRWEHPIAGPTWAIYNPPADLSLPGL